MTLELDAYDAGILPRGNSLEDSEWWQDYIRVELARAHEFYQSQISAIQPEAQGEDEADNQLCDERVDGPFVKVDIEDLSEAPNARAEALQGYSDTHSIPWKPEPKWR